MSFLSRRGIAFKLSLMVLSGITLVLGLMLVLNYRTSRRMMREIGRHMIAGESGFTTFKSLSYDRLNWMVYTPLKANGWSLGVLFPAAELMQDLNTLSRIMLGLGIGGFLLIMLVILVVSRQIARPLRELAASADRIAAGELDTSIPPPASHDEVGRLALSFSDMQRSLKEYIENLKITTAAKERIESELSIASEIQRGILPNIFPPLPRAHRFQPFRHPETGEGGGRRPLRLLYAR